MVLWIKREPPAIEQEYVGHKGKVMCCSVPLLHWEGVTHQWEGGDTSLGVIQLLGGGN